PGLAPALRYPAGGWVVGRLCTYDPVESHRLCHPAPPSPVWYLCALVHDGGLYTALPVVWCGADRHGDRGVPVRGSHSALRGPPAAGDFCPAACVPWPALAGHLH